MPFITNKARKLLKDYNWPGNVRELENVLQRAIVLCDGGTIDEKDIMIDINSGNNFYENLDDVKEIKQAVI